MEAESLVGRIPIVRADGELGQRLQGSRGAGGSDRGSDCRSENSVRGFFSEREAMCKKMEVVVSLGFQFPSH